MINVKKKTLPKITSFIKSADTPLKAVIQFVEKPLPISVRFYTQEQLRNKKCKLQFSLFFFEKGKSDSVL